MPEFNVCIVYMYMNFVHLNDCESERTEGIASISDNYIYFSS